MVPLKEGNFPKLARLRAVGAVEGTLQRTPVLFMFEGSRVHSRV